MTAMAPRLPWSAGALHLVVLSGGMTLVAGVLAIVDVVVLLPAKRKRRDIMVNPPPVRDLTVVLTAYNDEASIGLAVDGVAGPATLAALRGSAPARAPAASILSM